ncbi:hypothetical protein A2598_03575 [Candidatus Peribacteria bacterium RIFOXYD1_FULL_54_13]|nr:MAG: hypothetical protein UY90_C0006G0010 [Candidatus Peregrinibacteria bacterium GW2011_GWA2_54_9]OGJ83632.1 MAG: hypothetical protein A2598_03575 [Candidatus Peribacteria bacterium RIFOXYD1_FULL_54_13]
MPEGGNVPENADLRVETDEELSPLVSDGEVRQEAGKREKTARQETQAVMTGLSSREVPVAVDTNNPDDPVGRSLSAVHRTEGPKGQEHRSETQVMQEGERMIGEGLEMSPEEQRYLLQMETKYRQEYQRASKQGGFNQVEFKKNWIDQHGSEVAANTKFRLNPGVLGSPCIGIHTEKAPYKEPTPDQVRVLRSIEQKYNQELQRILQRNGNRPLPVQQLLRFKQEQITKFNQELAENNVQLRFHMGIPESYSFGVDWDGANAAEPPRNALVGSAEGPRDAASRAADRLNSAPRMGEALEAFLEVLGALLQKILEFIERAEKGETRGEKNAEDVKEDANVQKEIDAELKKPGMTREKLQEQTEGELKGAQEEAKKLEEDIPSAEKQLTELGEKEKSLQRQIDNPTEGVDVGDLKTQLRDVQEQKRLLEQSIGEKKGRLETLKKNIIPRLERKKRLLGAEKGGERKVQLTEEQRDQLDAEARNLREQLNPQIRERLGNFRLGLTEGGEPALFPESAGILKDIAGEKGYIALSDLRSPDFAGRVRKAFEKSIKGDARRGPGGEPGAEDRKQEGTPGGAPGTSERPDGSSTDVGVSVARTSEALTDYLRRTEDFIRRRVDMYRARVKGTQQEIDSASKWNVVDWGRQNVLENTLQQEQRALGQALDALRAIDAARGKVEAKIAIANDTTKKDGERVQVLKDGRKVLDGLRGLIQDPNYAKMNAELAAIDNQLAIADRAASAVSDVVENAGEGLMSAVNAIGDYASKIPGAAADIWRQDIVPGWNAHIQPHLSSLADWGGEQWDAVGKALGEIGDGFAILYKGTASEFGQAYKEQFDQMYGGGVQKLEGLLVSAGVPQEDVAAFKQMVVDSFDAAIDVTQDINNRGFSVVVSEMWDGVSHEVASAWGESIQPHLDTAGSWTQEQWANLGTLVREVTDGARSIAQGAPGQFGQNYKEQFNQVCGNAMQQIEDSLVQAGVDRAAIASFRQTVENSLPS